MAEFDTAHPQLRLHSLDIGENLLKDLGAEYLAMVASLRELKMLQMDRCEISEVGTRLFAKKANFDELRILNLSHNYVGQDGLKAILERKPKQLHTLLLSHASLTTESIEQIADAAASQVFRDLDLSGNDLTVSGANAILCSEQLRSLRILRFYQDALSIADLRAVKKQVQQRGIHFEWGEDEIPF
jgi:hypothetical protein